MHTNLIWLVVGIALGIIIVVIATTVSPLGNRYSISISSDGGVVHRVDARSGRVWIKNTITETGPDGSPVTATFWEELLPDRAAASFAAKGKRDSAIEKREVIEEQQKQTEVEEIKIQQRRLNDIASLCGDDMACVHEKCSTGYKGSPDPAWTTYCTETIYTNIITLIIDQCRGNDACIKSYCRNKHNNTYPAVSDCIRDINLVKITNENDQSSALPE